jgi:mRNA-degrading endonuclease RelE of RelBE toxin-antitoxin system
MSYSVIYTHIFEKELKKLAKKYPSIKSDIANLVTSLRENPTQGVEVLTNCYKIRFSIKSKGRGKSGGGRLITLIKIEHEHILLISVYDKSEKETLPDHILEYLIKDL